MKKFLKWTMIVLGALIVLLALAGLILYQVGAKQLAQTYPNIQVETVNIPTGANAVACGKHISIVWSCTKCHGEDLSGTLITNDPIAGIVPIMGVIPAPNLTSGKGGIAQSYTDADWIRAIRHGVKPNGHVEILMYDYSTMSDRDLGDLLAYLKQIPPVDRYLPEVNYGPFIPIAPAIGLFTPAAELMDHSAPRPAEPAPDATQEYGGYLAVLCTGCHGKSVANKLANWDQQDFIRTFHTGVLPDGKPLGPTMSSETFREMNDTELAALWLYLKSLPSAKK